VKILYISRGDILDYQDDLLFIGLRELLGPDVIDISKRKHCYTTFDSDEACNMYGKGMTVTRLLEDLDIDRTDIEEKIRKRHFDYVIYGSIGRYQAFLETVLASYPKKNIVFIDGEDSQEIFNAYTIGAHYFKRELSIDLPRLYPIHFAIPTKKFSPQLFEKKRDFSICDPRDRSTYIYSTEQDYYRGYKESRFAVTQKKAGWDCLRHYEILGNGAIPLFIDIGQCPQKTMTHLPKAALGQIQLDLEARTSPTDLYEKYAYFFARHTESRLTTECLAKHVLQTLNQSN